jgi:hypothetical protein
VYDTDPTVVTCLMVFPELSYAYAVDDWLSPVVATDPAPAAPGGTYVVAVMTPFPSVYAVTRPQLSYVVDVRPVSACVPGLWDAV